MRTLLAVAACFVLAGCSASAASGDRFDSSNGSALRFTLDLGNGNDRYDAVLTCPDSEDAGYLEGRGVDACQVVEELDDSVLFPPEGEICTQQYGGPETLRIQGHVGGRRVDTTVDRLNGCGIADWNELGVLVEPRS